LQKPNDVSSNGMRNMSVDPHLVLSPGAEIEFLFFIESHTYGQKTHAAFLRNVALIPEGIIQQLFNKI
ncbi:MAG: hypothetical protein OET79_16235, partial [Nitrospirota bacterium]|nr:hypothetical protein [Nitrospirota bacterium]